MSYSAPSTTPANLRDMVVQRVRSEILSGRHAPGAVYTVPSLATDLGISTTPVREALLELSRAGLVAPMRNRGFRVAGVSVDELNNLFAVREVLERFALVTLATQRLTDTAELRALADQIADAVQREDVHTYVQRDRAFHQALVSRTGNPLLTEMVMNLRDSMRLFGIESAAGRQRQIDSVAEHHRLIDLAVAGDTNGIAALISRHIMEWKPLFTEALSSRQPA